MNEGGGENQTQRIGMIAGILVAFLVLRRLRKRRKQKKLLKARAKAKARQVERRLKEEEAKKKKDKKKGKKGKKDRSIAEQLVRFTILAVMKKIISQQIEQAGSQLGTSKLGKKVVETVEA